MIRLIVGSSLRLRLLVVAIAVGVFFLGVNRLVDMPVDIFPEFSPPLVEIQTEALGLSAAEVEQMITVPLESDLLNGVPWLDVIRSESVTGLSSIELIFEPGTKVMRARQMVQERLTQAHALPNVSKPPQMLQPLSSTNRVMMIGLSSKNLSLIEMSVLARWTIMPRLMGVPGVANVAIWGQRERQLQVQVDPDRLEDTNVSLLQIIKTTGNALWVSPLSFLNASTPGTGGFIDTPNQRLGIRHILPITSAEDLANVTVEGAKLRLSDVARVVEDHQPLIGDAVTGQGPGLLLVIEKFPGANTLDVTEEVDGALAAMRPGLTGLEIDSSIYRPATYIHKAINNVRLALLIGAALLILLLLAFFYEWRTALISLVAIPLSLIAAALVLHLRHATFNTMVLAGLMIALGVVVDDAVMDVQNIVRRLRQQRKEGNGKSTAGIILEASLEMRGPMVFATMIVLLAAVPLFLMQGVAGALFKPLALSYALAVLASMLVAWTVTPVLSFLLLSQATLQPRESPVARWLERGHEGILPRILRRPLPMYITAGILLMAGLTTVPWLHNGSLFPAFKENNLLIRWDATPGTSRPEMNRLAGQASRELKAIPGVRNVGAHVGRAVLSDQVVGINSGELWVTIDPNVDYDATVASVQECVKGYPGFDADVMTYAKERLFEAMTGVEEPIVVRIYGEDLGVLRRKAEEVKTMLAGIKGVVGPKVEHPIEEPTLEIEVNLAASQRYGLKPGDVRRAAATLLSGILVGNLFEGQKVFEVVVWGAPEVRHSLSSIRDLLIDTPSGGHVRLGEVADVRIVPSPNIIKREAVSRRIDVNAGLEGRAFIPVAREIKERLGNVQFPLEYHAELRGEYAEHQAAQKRMLAFVLAAAFGIFLLLQATFGSWRLAVTSFLTLPLVLAGAALAVFTGGGELTLSALLGFITVLGIAVRNSIMLIRHYQSLEQQGVAFGPELVLRGTRERLVPSVVTLIGTGLAVLPFVLLGDIPGTEILRPMAFAVLGGLVTSTLSSLFVVPALYLAFGAGARERDVLADTELPLREVLDVSPELAT